MFTFQFRLAAACALLSLVAVTATATATDPEIPDAPPLSLREAVRNTLDHNPELAQFAFQFQAQEARAAGAGLRPAPEFSSQMENVLGTGSTRGLSGAEATFALSQVIELGGQRARRIEAAQGRRDQIEVDREIAQLDVLAEVGRRFIHVAFDQKQLELTGLATRLAEQTVAEIERRVNDARSPRVELNRARITLARAQVQQEHAEHELLTSRRKLATMWGRREPDFGPVDAALFELPRIKNVEALAQRLSRSPDFMQFATEARQRDAEIALALSQARGSITVSGGLRRLQQTQDTALVAGVSMPLFSARRAQPAIAEAEALRAGIDSKAAAQRIRAEASLFAWVQELRHAITEATVLRDEVLPQMEAALADTRTAWQRGRYSYLEWTEAQRERIEIERALIVAAADAHLYRVEIERLTGAALTDPNAVATAGVAP